MLDPIDDSARAELLAGAPRGESRLSARNGRRSAYRQTNAPVYLTGSPPFAPAHWLPSSSVAPDRAAVARRHPPAPSFAPEQADSWASSSDRISAHRIGVEPSSIFWVPNGCDPKLGLPNFAESFTEVSETAADHRRKDCDCDRGPGGLIREQRLWWRWITLARRRPGLPADRDCADMKFTSSGMTGRRVLAAPDRRVRDPPHRTAWRRSELARQHPARLEALRDRSAGDRCVLVGNGPSLARSFRCESRTTADSARS